jgi:hypothetical protein
MLAHIPRLHVQWILLQIEDKGGGTMYMYLWGHYGADKCERR